jgi:two-component system cell cycle response regulator
MMFALSRATVDSKPMRLASRSPAVTVMFAATVLMLAAYAIHGVLHPGVSLSTQIMYDAIVIIPAGLVLMRARGRSDGRAVWALLGLGMLSWALGNVAASWFYDPAHVPIPSVCDGLWLGIYPPWFVAVGLIAYRARHRVGRMRGSGLWLDGVIGILAVFTLSAQFVLEPVLGAQTGLSTAAFITDLAYPIGDALLLGILIASMAMSEWRIDRQRGILAAAVLAFVASDTIFLLQITNGTFVAGGLVDLGWLCAAPLIALAAYVPDASTMRRERQGRGMVFAPVGLALVALVLVVSEGLGDHNAMVLIIGCATLACAIVRMAVSFAANQRLLHSSREDAATDPLTGLGNRRRMYLDLEQPVTEERVLALFDLDGFKLYNDTFGHSAGDGLLRLIGEALERAIGDRGSAYRMGGDEFCAFIDPAGGRAEHVAGALAAAMAHTGNGFHVTASVGAVSLPEEATGAVDALHLADRRMYENKNRLRSSAGRQSADVLMAILQERNPDLGGHVAGVSGLAAAVGQRLGISDVELENLRHAAELHDIGKMAVPDAILSKPGPLDDSEWDLMRQHTVVGERVLGAAPSLEPIGALVRATHERWDGSGYPDAKTGEDIPLGARIIFVCDAFDAMVSDRPYGRPRTVEQAIEELRRCAGTQFDPGVVDAFLAAVAQDGSLTRSEPSLGVPAGQAQRSSLAPSPKSTVAA